MAGTFGGYGLPLEGHLPAEFSGEGGVYALEEGNLLPANAQAPEALEEGVVRDEGLVKARVRRFERVTGARGRPALGAYSPPDRLLARQAVAGRTWSGVEYGVAPVYAYSFFQARLRAPGRGHAPRRQRTLTPLTAVRGRRAPRRPAPVPGDRAAYLGLVVPHSRPRRGRRAAHCV